MTILVKKQLKITSNQDFSVSKFNCEIVSVDIFGKKQRIRIFVVYRPPQTSLKDTKSLVKFLQRSFLSSQPNIILGDFNFPKIEWESPLLPSNETDKIFKEFIVTNNFSQMVTFPTMIRKAHILDLIFTTEKSLIFNCSPSDFSLTANDHISVLFSLRLIKFDNNTPDRYYHDYRSGDYENLNKFLANIHWDRILSIRDTEDAFYNFYALLYEGIELFIPKKTPTNRNSKTYPKFLQKLLKKN